MKKKRKKERIFSMRKISSSKCSISVIACVSVPPLLKYRSLFSFRDYEAVPELDNYDIHELDENEYSAPTIEQRLEADRAILKRSRQRRRLESGHTSTSTSRNQSTRSIRQPAAFDSDDEQLRPIPRRAPGQMYQPTTDALISAHLDGVMLEVRTKRERRKRTERRKKENNFVFFLTIFSLNSEPRTFLFVNG
jgi:hypothetical protein